MIGWVGLYSNIPVVVELEKKWRCLVAGKKEASEKGVSVSLEVIEKNYMAKVFVRFNHEWD